MEPLQYAVVAYVRNSIGRFVEQLRREVDPRFADFPAHLTILPPRCLSRSESEAREMLEAVCRGHQPFEVSLGEVETFIPTTPVVFIRVAHAAYKMRELHDHLNTGAFHSAEPWPYMPHLTIINSEEMERAKLALPVIRQRWSEYLDSRQILVDEISFVRQNPGNHWEDLALIPLGDRLASKTR
jgi:2'-5' RNA ligase